MNQSKYKYLNTKRPLGIHVNGFGFQYDDFLKRELDILGNFFVIYSKGDTVCDYLFASMHSISLLQKGVLLEFVPIDLESQHCLLHYHQCLDKSTTTVFLLAFYSEWKT